MVKTSFIRFFKLYYKNFYTISTKSNSDNTVGVCRRFDRKHYASIIRSLNDPFLRRIARHFEELECVIELRYSAFFYIKRKFRYFSGETSFNIQVHLFRIKRSWFFECKFSREIPKLQQYFLEIMGWSD